MRFACLDPAARAAIASLSVVSASLWAFLGIKVGCDPAEDFDLAGWAAITCSLALVALVIGVMMRDSIRAAVLGAVIASQPDDGPAPLHLVKAERDAG